MCVPDVDAASKVCSSLCILAHSLDCGDYGCVCVGVKVMFTQIRSDIMEVVKYVTVIKNEVAATADADVVAADRFKKKMSEFLLDFEQKVSQVKAQYEAINKAFAACLKFYGEDEMSVDDFLKTFATFVGDYANARAENGRDKVMAEKASKESSQRLLANEMRLKQEQKKATAAQSDNATTKAKATMVSGRNRVLSPSRLFPSLSLSWILSILTCDCFPLAGRDRTLPLPKQVILSPCPCNSSHVA